MSGRVTIKSIARDLGISHMTVSRALSNHPNVQKETRAAVLKRAAELGYVKSAAARAMRGDGTRIVGLLLPNIVNEFYARLANTMAQACEAHAHHLIIHLTNDDIDVERQSLERLREVQAMAVAMVPAPATGANIGDPLTGMKVVQLIRKRAMETPSIAVLVDDHNAIRDAVVHLARAGHRSIGYIGAQCDMSSGQDRLRAFQNGLKEATLDEISSLVHTGTPSYEMGRFRTAEMLDRGLATGIICGGVEISNGSLSALLERRGKLSTDIGFVGYGDPSFYAWIEGGVSTVRLPIDKLAYKTIELLQQNWTQDFLSQNEATRFDAQLMIRNGTSG